MVDSHYKYEEDVQFYYIIPLPNLYKWVATGFAIFHQSWQHDFYFQIFFEVTTELITIGESSTDGLPQKS